jgi:hypothetical protein
MSSRKTGKVRFTYDGANLLDMFLAPTKDQGLSFGFTHPSFRNVHLTIYHNPKDGRLHAHISDPAAKVLPWSQQIDIQFLAESLRRSTRSWNVSFEKVPKVYVMRESLLQKVAGVSPRPVDERTAQFQLELLHAEVRLNFRNPLRWRKLNSQELAATPPFFGYALVNGVAKAVRPNPAGQLLVFSDRQFRRVQAKLERLLGAEMFGEYLDTRKVGDDYFRAMRAQVRSMGKPRRVGY